MSQAVRMIVLIIGVLAMVGCGSGGAATVGPSLASSPAPGAATPEDAAFAWCVDIANQLAMNKAAKAVAVDLDHLQAIHTIAGQTLDQYRAAIRGDADFMKVCDAAYAAR